MLRADREAARSERRPMSSLWRAPWVMIEVVVVLAVSVLVLLVGLVVPVAMLARRAARVERKESLPPPADPVAAAAGNMTVDADLAGVSADGFSIAGSGASVAGPRHQMPSHQNVSNPENEVCGCTFGTPSEMPLHKDTAAFFTCSSDQPMRRPPTPPRVET